ncbi:MAG TPA: sugar ABC transporter permease [Ruminiclostridium sp.]
MQRSKKNWNKKAIDYAWGYFMIAPTIIGLLILNIWPLIQTMYLSLCKLSGFGSAKFIGFDNYIKMFHDKELLKTILNTVEYTILSVPIAVVLSLILAVLLNTNIKYKFIYRTLYFIPVVSTPAAIAMVWKWLMNYDYGLINYILSIFKIDGPNWISDPKFALFSLVIVGVWSCLGYNMVILLAGLQEIPKTFYEAAEIDGAKSINKFFLITIPMVSPTLFFVVITTLMSSLQIFDLIFMMIGNTNPALPNVQSLVFLFYRYSFFISNKGYGSAIAILLFMIIMIFTLIQLLFQKKWVHYE